MSTYSKLRDLRKKYETELEHQRTNGFDDSYVQLLEEIIEDLTEVGTYASWAEYPEDMGR